MNSAQEIIRIEKATRADLDALVALHLACLPANEHFAVALGFDFLQAAFQWLLSSSGTFVLVAKCDDRIIGLTALSDKPYGTPMLRACKWTVLRGLAFRPWLLFRMRIASRLRNIVGDSSARFFAKGVGQIAWTVMHPDYQRRGIGLMLKKESICRCRNLGMIAVVTYLKRENLRSRALNERVGFVVVPELCSKRFLCLRLNLE